LAKASAFATLLAVGVVIGLSLASLVDNPRLGPVIEWLDEPRAVRDFNLQASSAEFNNHSLQGRWTIVLFGFLHCPDVCPTSIAELATLADRFSEVALLDDVAYVFVSVDPGRDSVEDVDQYAQAFAPAMHGVTGEHLQIRRFTNDLGIQYSVSADINDYSVAHSVTFSIIDPSARLRGRFRPGFDLDHLSREFESMLAKG